MLVLTSSLRRHVIALLKVPDEYYQQTRHRSKNVGTKDVNKNCFSTRTMWIVQKNRVWGRMTNSDNIFGFLTKFYPKILKFQLKSWKLSVNNKNSRFFSANIVNSAGKRYLGSDDRKLTKFSNSSLNSTSDIWNVGQNLCQERIRKQNAVQPLNWVHSRGAL